LRRLRAEFQSLKRAAQEAERQQHIFERRMNAGKFAIAGFTSSLKNLARSYLSIFAVFTGLGAAFRSIKEIDTIKASFLAASGSVNQAAVDFKYVSEVALKTGRDLTSLSRGYSQIAVAAKEACISTKEMKNIFMSAVEASTAFGLSAADTDGVIRAFVQMLSKGKITAEELRQQLGDRLPIAVPAMARALG